MVEADSESRPGMAAGQRRLQATVEAFCGCIRLCAAQRLAFGDLEGWDKPGAEKAYWADLDCSIEALKNGDDQFLRAAVDIMILWWNRLAN